MSNRNDHHPPPALVVEVEGPLACFTRPELKTERLSYPVMTPSAARGVLEAIFWKPEFQYVVTQIDMLSPVKWVSIRRNEVQSMPTVDWVRRAMSDRTVVYDVEEDRDQRNTVCLRDVAYRIHAQVELKPHAVGTDAKYRDMFRRRVDRGACFSQPFLGAREFSVAKFVKQTDRSPHPVNEQIGVMLHGIDYLPEGERYRWFDAVIENGVLRVPRQGIELPRAATTRQGR